MFDVRDKAHKDYLAKLEKNANFVQDMTNEQTEMQAELEKLEAAVKAQQQQ